ncbi:hypothetical protein FDT66_03365 [Polaribacter aestuariivivens]|uniref:Peptidase E n=1 Tax=Polaribacter aestuariivivens TaxID=2304626 RepID=A0A5S3NBS7_9FLAO|nr:DUF6702 family protein [Polaribacter aestuariivivens]TMM31019.1 hypothetical protein FDT66_03365 [Polaribacter aestuariivivens]
MKHKKYLFLFIIIPLLSFSTHKYYLSLTQIKFKEEAKSVQIIINVFMDDIEKALNEDYNIDLQLTTKKELENNDVFFEKYLKSKLAFKVDNLSKDFKYLGKEYEGDLVFFYLEIENIPSVKSIDISNKILIKHFPEQQNLIKSKVGNKNKSVLLSKDNYQEKLTY